MTTEHLRPLLDSQRDMNLLHEVCQQLARAEVSLTIIDAIRLGRMTALTKPNGGVRGIVSGDVIRRLTARTIAQQLGKVVEAATAPFQYALSTRAGCECVAHILQALCEINPQTTVVSVDGISAYDVVSRQCLKVSIRSTEEQKHCHSCACFTVLRVVHTIDQGEGGEQGDPFMPLLFSLGQHGA